MIVSIWNSSSLFLVKKLDCFSQKQKQNGIYEPSLIQTRQLGQLLQPQLGHITVSCPPFSAYKKMP